MNDINNETADGLVSLIRKIVREEIANAQRNSGVDIETFRHCLVTTAYDTSGKVVSKIEDDTVVASADIKDLATGEIIRSVPNKSGEAFIAGDTVRIYETNGSYNSCYIGLKCL